MYIYMYGCILDCYIYIHIHSNLSSSEHFFFFGFQIFRCFACIYMYQSFRNDYKWTSKNQVFYQPLGLWMREVPVYSIADMVHNIHIDTSHFKRDLNMNKKKIMENNKYTSLQWKIMFNIKYLYWKKANIDGTEIYYHLPWINT